MIISLFFLSKLIANRYTLVPLPTIQTLKKTKDLWLTIVTNGNENNELTN